ncbi:hypothetical protein [Alienimonas californiensis]|uniref:Uncharacterized protein n=1 Tax=Alienimonas californiensis TaxID=2527989 RepID=A0A517P9W3_9PLAN|nr:hypothetical protein [Alienimonas californiensis]QDT16167.1 hypothetical protein CA12_22650 [Alienimonas californiensis]
MSARPDALDDDPDRAGAIEALILEGLYQSEGDDPELQRPDAANGHRTVGILDAVLLHQIGTTGLMIVSLVIFAPPPAGGWGAMWGKAQARPDMVGLFFGFGAFAGGLIAAAMLVGARGAGFRVGWIGQPPLFCSFLLAGVSLTALFVVSYGIGWAIVLLT